jgi:uncharacterized protein (TIGR03663 family)
MNRSLALALALALGCAMVLRLPDLNERPMHNDEAVNAIKFGHLWEQGTYKYDPNEHHGPTIYYAALTLGRVTGAPDFEHYTEKRLRLVTVLFGLGCLLILPLLTDALGQNGTAWASVFLALSPAMVFYSRYFIHEILLVFFTVFALAAGWRYCRSRQLAWALAAGGGLGLMVVTKETFVLTLAAVVIALWLNHTWNRLLDASGLPEHASKLIIWHLAAALVVCLAVVVVFFTSFFTNASGLTDAIRTFTPWIKRAGGETPHIHAWNFYLHRLLFFHAGPGPVWTEAFIMALAVVGAVCGFRRRYLGGANASFVRFVALYTLLLTAFYSLLAYKTPWCLLNFWFGAVLLSGVGAAALLRLIRVWHWKVALVVGLLIGSGHLAWQSWQQDTTYAADQRNPYVYAQTSPDLLNLVARVQALASVSPQRQQMLIKVMAPEEDYWPLPWYLRQFKQVGWWDKVPEEPFASVMIVSSKLRAGLDAQKTHLMVRYYALRPQVLLELYVEKQLWQDWLAKRPPPPED